MLALIFMCTIPFCINYFKLIEIKDAQSYTRPLPTSKPLTPATTQVTTTAKMLVCSEISPYLSGPTNIVFSDNSTDNWPPTLEETSRKFINLELGGYYPGPKECILPVGHSVGVIIPFRGREEHLKYLLHYLHGILQRQQMRYVIVVAEQNDDDAFNKAQLMNTAFNYIMKTYNQTIDCLVFHDVDVISEDDRALYRCNKSDDKVVHLAHRIDKFNYKFCCGITVGGILILKAKQFYFINGFSNQYYGWGGEDDDAYQRIKEKGKYEIYRPQEDYYRFKMIHHERDQNNKASSRRYSMLNSWKERQSTDGLNSLQTKIEKIIKYYTHTRLLITPSKLIL